MATPNMPASEWPELEPEDLRAIAETLQGSQAMRSEQNNGPLPGTDS